MKYIIFYLLFLSHGLMATESIYAEAKMVIKLIDKKDIQFISAEESIFKIKGSKTLAVNGLSVKNILGKVPCLPYTICSKKIEERLSKLSITPIQKLVIYDESYGIYAAWLYTTLESMGHKNMLILNGGARAILNIDPNQETYNTYSNDLNISLQNNENNESSREIERLKEKLKVLKPLLLVETQSIMVENSLKSTYKSSKKNSDYFLSKSELKEAVAEVRVVEESNITIVDVCPMVDIVGNETGSYLSGVKVLSWKNIINKQEHSVKSTKTLNMIFTKAGLDKEKNNYLYCMSGSEKALFVLTAMRDAGYVKIKAFTGDWNVWIGGVDE